MGITSRTLHILVGLGSLLLFLGSGLYMDMHFPGLYGNNEAIRYQFRANHIYILMAGLINLAAGLYPAPARAGWRLALGHLASALLLLAPAMLVAAFCLEPVQGGEQRPLTFYGVLMLLLGVLAAHLPALRGHHRRHNG